VRVTDEQDFDIREMKAKPLDTVADQRDGTFEVRVDENVARGRHNEVRGEVLAADVVEVVGDTERGDRRGPRGACLRCDM
jgi:hypothetical protein